MNTAEQDALIKRINELKDKRNAVILVHNYQRPEIYEVADFIGDSLGLSKQAAGTDREIIVFCGVKFMAETAKILSPEKTVLLPAYDAGCPMADMVTAEGVRELRARYPNAAVVSYINTNADVKAESDVCCTSANAVEVVNSIDADEIIFVPDKNLAAYVQTKTGKKIIPWNGFCYVHNRISGREAKLAKERYPDAVFIAHPECPPEVLDCADYVTSTGGMVKYAVGNIDKRIIVGTEVGMINRLKRENPSNEYFTIGKTCVNMKKTTLELVLAALEARKHEITIPLEIQSRAKNALDCMLEVNTSLPTSPFRLWKGTR